MMMKKKSLCFALLLALLLLLVGTALADVTVKILGVEYSAGTEAKYWLVDNTTDSSQSTLITDGASESNYNIKLVLGADNIPHLTLKNANLTSPESCICTFNSSIVITGEGSNTLQSTSSSTPAIYVNGNCTMKGRFESILQNNSYCL